MTDVGTLTPGTLIAILRLRDPRKSRAAIDRFLRLPADAQAAFEAPAIDFIGENAPDDAKAWCVSVLERTASAGAREILELLLTDDQARRKPDLRFTRFFAFGALVRLAEGSQYTRPGLDLAAVAADLRRDADEDRLLKAVAELYLARESRPDIAKALKKQLTGESYEDARAVLRALQEMPSILFVNELLAVLDDSRFLDLRGDAARALAKPEYRLEPKVIRKLGDVVLMEPHRSLRLLAVEALRAIGSLDARADLLTAIEDEDAEVRAQASDALCELMGAEGAVRAIVNRALADRAPHAAVKTGFIVAALTRADEKRLLATEILSRELGSSEEARAQLAERLLVDLGGWAAVQRLGQRRTTLKDLDELLKQSESTVNSTFQKTMSQARLNFRFALLVNVVIVLFGVVLFGIAVREVHRAPERLVDWAAPATGGLFAMLLGRFFSNPRRNAREDLGALVNVNMIYLGYLRQLNHVDAAFKHAFLESFNFGMKDMQTAVQQIQTVLTAALRDATHHLYARPAKWPWGRKAKATEEDAENVAGNAAGAAAENPA